MALKNGVGTVKGYKIGPKADLQGADLRDADLSDADLREAKLNHAHLTGAKLRFANLRDADFYRANLSCADLYYADLTGADLHGADLIGADFTAATVDPVHLPLIEEAHKGMMAGLTVNGGRAPNPRHYGPRGRYGR